MGSGLSGVSKVNEEEKSTGEAIPVDINNIPTCDLGESLDAQRTSGQQWKQAIASSSTRGSSSFPITEKDEHHSSSSSTMSEDSGIYCEYEDAYSHIITESSAPELVKRVETSFNPATDLDLIIMGKACSRLLSGTQRFQRQEADILESLRQEGFISTSEEKSSGGLSFEIVDSNGVSSAESRRMQLQMRLGHKSKGVSETGEQCDSEKVIEEMRRKKELKMDSALEKRELHLKRLRDKLKENNKKVQNLKLKKLVKVTGLVPSPVNVLSDFRKHDTSTNDEFFP